MSTRPDTRHKYKTTAAITVSAVFLITHRCGTSTVCRVRIWFNEWIKPHHGWQSVAILRRGLGGPWPPRFLSGPPACPPSVLLNFTFKFAWLTHTADNFRPAIFYVYVVPPTFVLGPAVAPTFFILESPLLVVLLPTLLRVISDCVAWFSKLFDSISRTARFLWSGMVLCGWLQRLWRSDIPLLPGHLLGHCGQILVD